MKFINFDNYIEKNDNEYILIKTVLYLNILVILLFQEQLDVQKPIYCLIF